MVDALLMGFLSLGLLVFIFTMITYDMMNPTGKRISRRQLNKFRKGRSNG